MNKKIVQILFVFAAVCFLLPGVAAAADDVITAVNATDQAIKDGALVGLEYDTETVSYKESGYDVTQNFTTSEDQVSFTLNATKKDTSDKYVVKFGSGAHDFGGPTTTEYITTTTNLGLLTIGEFDGYGSAMWKDEYYNPTTKAFLIERSSPKEEDSSLTNLVNITLDTSSIEVDEVGTITIPWAVVYWNGNGQMPTDYQSGKLTVNIKKVASLGVYSYNGYTQDKSGNEVNDSVTETPLKDVTRVGTDYRYSINAAAEIVYNSSIPSNGVIDFKGKSPVFYAYKGNNLTLNPEKVHVSFWNADETQNLGNEYDALWNADEHTVTLDFTKRPAGASKVHIQFQGHMLGDFDFNGRVVALDKTYLGWQVSGSTVKLQTLASRGIIVTDETLFYSDIDFNGRVVALDATYLGWQLSGSSTKLTTLKSRLGDDYKRLTGEI